MRLKDSLVMVTGAAGQLGRAFARSFVREGALLWLCDAEPEALKEAASQVPAHQLVGTRVFDITQPEAVSRAFEALDALKTPLDVLVNNAGIGIFSPFWDRDYAEFMQVLSVNVGGTFLCTREALRRMREQKSGSIINIGSVYGVVSSDPRIYTDCARMNSEVYSASKAGVIQMTKYFAVHAAPLGVRVNCVSPGGVFNEQGKDFVHNYAQRTPMARMADEDDIAGAVIYLASPQSRYVSGQNIVIDGGFSSW